LQRTTGNMTDQERNRQRDHWQAIAEQLGLAREAESAELEHGARQERSTPAERSAEPEESITAQEAGQQEAGFLTEESDQTEAVDAAETVAEAQAEDRDAAREESDEQHGRRRGRRRRGGKSRPRNEEKANEPAERGISRADDFAPEDEEASPRQHRQRGRGHEDSADVAELEEADAPALETIEQEAEDDTEIEELGDFSNWNVPSWNELIASLYRPER
jgi:hypothetical protein